jgi:putative SOS response-associated peptidase YedK
VCGRFASFLPPETIARIFGTSNPLPNIGASWNMAPTRDAMVVRRHPETGERHLDLLNWGLLPFFTKDPKTARRPINARAETVQISGMFKAAFAKRRCLVPAAAFYEWRAQSDGKQPFAIARGDGCPLALAGLWEGWRAPDGEILRTFAIVTAAANAEMAALHDRMPVILEEADWPVWLAEEAGDAATLMRPAPEGILKLWPISRRVNNVRNDDADLLEPLPAPGPPPGTASPPGPNSA